MGGHGRPAVDDAAHHLHVTPQRLRHLADSECELILRALERARWRIKGPKGAAAALGLNPPTLYGRMKKLGIRPPGPADLNPVRGSEQAGLRPVLILSHDVFNERSGTVIAVALTGQEPKAGFPLTLESGAAGLPKRSWIKISQIRTLGVERIGRRLARASEEELEKVIDGLNEIISSP